ncbi:hypothetical protein P0Y35_18275 [Kiritimatiellaeota bacterium B1221]|nr:hypothetical protein [Kiritimatiellaeota bacterium B1221]
MNFKTTTALLICLNVLSFIYSEEPTQEQITLIRNWLSHTSETKIHQMRGATGNKLFLHQDGHKEAVFDKEGHPVKDGINDASYNYAHPIEEPLNHFNMDILPWLLWGSSRLDPTSVEERVEAYSRALGGGLVEVQNQPIRNFDYSKIDKNEARVIVFFLRVLKEGDVEEIFNILKEPEYKAKEPLKIGQGLTKGLNKILSSGEFKPVKPE